MNPDLSHDTCSDEAAGLLPWFVNGTLDAEDASRVKAHLGICARCRDDVAWLEIAGTLLRTPSSVEYAPQAGWRKLLARVDQHAAGDPQAPAPNSLAPTTAPRPAGRMGRGAVPWLAAAVVVQAVTIAVMVGSDVLQPASSDAPATFRTLTSGEADGPHLRVVFAPAMTLAELQELLRANPLVAVGGPSDAGIFTLALSSQTPGAQTPADVVTRLRADARVRFAESVGTEAGPR